MLDFQFQSNPKFGFSNFLHVRLIYALFDFSSEDLIKEVERAF